MMGALKEISNFTGSITGFFGGVVAVGDYLVLAAMIAVVGWVCARLFSNSVMSMALAVGASVIMMFFAVTDNWIVKKQSDYIRELEATVRFEQAKRAEIEATNAQLQTDLAAEADASEYNAGIMADILKQIEDKPDCGVPREFTDELRKLR